MPKNPGTAKKLNKKSADLFKKNFSLNREATLKTTTKSGVEFTGTTTASSKGVIGKLAAKFAGSNGFSVDKFEISSAGQFAGDIALKGAVDNAKLTLNTVLVDLQKPADGEKSVLGMEYTGSNYTATVEVDPLKLGKKGFGAVSCAMGLTDNWSAGVSACLTGKVETDTGALKLSEVISDTVLGVKYAESDYFVYCGVDGFHLAPEDKGVNHLKMEAHHQYDSATEFAMQFLYDSKKGLSTQFGGKLKLNDGSTFAGKVNQNGDSQVSYTNKINNMMKLRTTFAMPLGFLDSKGQISNVKFGFNLDMGDI